MRTLCYFLSLIIINVYAIFLSAQFGKTIVLKDRKKKKALLINALTFIGGSVFGMLYSCGINIYNIFS